MFQFRRFPSYTYFIQYMMTKLSLSDCSIRISTDHIMLADPRGFSQLTASFVGSWCQGILPTLLLAWPVWIMFSSFRLLIVVNYPTSKKFLLSLSHNFLICITFTSIIQFSSFCFNYLYQIAKKSGLRQQIRELRSRKDFFNLIDRLGRLNGHKWTRTTDLTLIRRAL